VRGIPPEKRRIGLVYQDYSLFPHMTVEKNIAFGMRMRHLPKPEITERVRQLMHQFGISHIAARAPFTLSGGEQQRVAIARALALEPELLLLDEPLAGLNLEEVEDMARFILDINEEARWKVTCILVEHDMGVVMDISHRVFVLNFGNKIVDGTPKEVQSNQEVIKAYLGEEDLYASRR